MPRTTPSLLDGLEVLRGWRPIARFLRIAPRTARYWRTKYSLPVFESASGGIWTLPLEFRRFDLILDQLIQKRRKEKATRKWRPGEKRVDNPLDHGVYGKGQGRARVNDERVLVGWHEIGAFFRLSERAMCSLRLALFRLHESGNHHHECEQEPHRNVHGTQQ